MRTIPIIALMALLLASAIPAQSASSKGTIETAKETIYINAATVSITGSGDRILQGNVYIKSVDKATKAVMEAKGSRVLVKFAPAGSKTTGSQFSSVQSAEITGPATIVYTTTQPTGVVTTTATTDKAIYTGSDKIARLIGKVRIVQESPMYAKPTVITGETATVNIDSGASPEVVSIQVDTPGGVSQVEAAPSATEETYVSATNISVMRSGNIVIQDNVFIKSIDKAAMATMEAKGSKAVIEFSPAEPKTSNVQSSSLQNAEITGHATIVYTTTQPSGTNKITATADKAIYSGSDKIARLTGGVQIIQEDPIYAKPAVVTGETAMVNLNPNPGPDDITIQVDTPGGVSRIEVTPRPKEVK